MSKKQPVQKSKNHIAFAAGKLGSDSANGLTARCAKTVGPNDWEFFTDRTGTVIYRAKVSSPLEKVRKPFAGVVRQPADMIGVGNDIAVYIANKHGGNLPPAVRDAQAKEAEQRAENRVAASRRSTSSAGVGDENKTVSRSRVVLPEGWKLENKETSTGRKYKVYHAPDGKKFQSRKKALEYSELLAV